MAEEFKRQHIVPQAYLNRFAEKGNRKTYIIGTRYNDPVSSEIKLYTQAVSKVGYIDNYYDTGRKPPKYWENFLGKNYDTLYGNPLGNIIAGITLAKNKSVVLSDASKDILSRIIISQMFRVPAVINERAENANVLLVDFKREFLGNNTVPQKYANVVRNLTISENDRKDLVLDAIFDENRMAKFCAELKRRVWIVFFNANRKVFPYCTSDNPVILCNAISGKLGLSDNGIGRIDTSIVFPLSPAIAVGLYHPSYAFGAIRELDGKKELLHDDAFTLKINNLVTAQSYKQTFLPEPLFSECKRITNDT